MEGPPSIRDFGEMLRLAREQKGLTREALAAQLNLSSILLEALESGDWEALPWGQERPLARQVAEKLGVPPSAQFEAWFSQPGEVVEDQPDPGQDRLERIVMALLAAGTVGLVAWLVLPGPSLRRRAPAATPVPVAQAPLARPSQPAQAYPVLGEALPEAPQTAEGFLVVLRALDQCEARIVGEGLDQKRTLQVSEPWKLRVPGSFSVELDNAGVVALEVAGKPIRHGQSVGEHWTGRFSANGAWVRPTPADEPPPTSPDTAND